MWVRALVFHVFVCNSKYYYYTRTRILLCTRVEGVRTYTSGESKSITTTLNVSYASGAIEILAACARTHDLYSRNVLVFYTLLLVK